MWKAHQVFARASMAITIGSSDLPHHKNKNKNKSNKTNKETKLRCKKRTQKQLILSKEHTKYSRCARLDGNHNGLSGLLDLKPIGGVFQEQQPSACGPEHRVHQYLGMRKIIRLILCIYFLKSK